MNNMCNIKSEIVCAKFCGSEWELGRVLQKVRRKICMRVFLRIHINLVWQDGTSRHNFIQKSSQLTGNIRYFRMSNLLATETQDLWLQIRMSQILESGI